MSQAASAGRALRPEQIDELGRTMLLLARELWVVRDRQLVTEAVLAARGMDIREAVAAYQPDPAMAAALTAERERFTSAILASLCPEIAQ